MSDPFGKSALPLTVLNRKKFREDCSHLFALAEQYDVHTIILGLPLDLREREGRQSEKVRFFAAGFEKFLKEQKSNIKIELYDESFSSKEAASILLEADVSRKKRKKVIDKIAAQRILQHYLDEHG